MHYFYCCMYLLFLLLSGCDGGFLNFSSKTLPPSENMHQKNNSEVSFYSPFNAEDKTSQHIDNEFFVAEVNGTVISRQDLENRINLSLLGTNNKLSEKEKLKISKEILPEMINELVRYKEAKKYAPYGGWVTAEQIDQSVKDIAARNNMSLLEFTKILEKNSLNINMLREHSQYSLSWIEFVRALYSKQIVISNYELQNVLNNIKSKKDKTSYFVSRIFLPIEHKFESEAVKVRAINLKNMLLKGAHFYELASQFSKAPEAVKGGNLGWIFQGQINEEEYATLSTMEMGGCEVSKTNGGYSILALKDKIEAGKKVFTLLKFQKVLFPISNINQISQTDLYNISEKIKKLRNHARNSDEFVKLAKTNSAIVSDVNEGMLESLPKPLANIINKIPKKCIGESLLTHEGFLIICVHEKLTQDIKEPTIDEIRSNKINEKLSMFADAKLEELKRKAEITINPVYDLKVK